MEEGAGAAVVEDGGAAGSAIFFEGRRSQVKGRNRRGARLWGRADAGRRRARGSGRARAARAVRCWGAVVEMPAAAALLCMMQTGEGRE